MGSNPRPPAGVRFPKRCARLVAKRVAAPQRDEYLSYIMYRSEEQTTAPSGPAPTVMEAIVRLRCVAARYNGGNVVLAPHVLFMKNDALHIGALTIERDGKVPREAKIGIFKLDGLGDLRLIERAFDVNPVFEPEDERFIASTLLKVEPAQQWALSA